MGIPQNLQAELLDRFNISVSSSSSIHGGDINEARLLVDEKGKKYFLKFSDEEYAADMLQKERYALQLLSDTQCLPIPEIFGTGSSPDHGFLLLEYIEKGKPTHQSWTDFAIGLANLHRNTSDSFGFSHDNYIGKLIQENTQYDSWGKFYTEMRLTPQRNLLLSGKQNTSLLKILDTFITKVPELINEVEPSLVHGDLWSGNYHPDKSGKIYLIDPSVSYSSREMDIAMSMLFGGFSPTFYEVYHSSFPLTYGWKARIEIYQLYYLLVHVNLFGGSYIDSAMRIIKKYV